MLSQAARCHLGPSELQLHHGLQTQHDLVAPHTYSVLQLQHQLKIHNAVILL